ncbi:hypothetical protein TRFO_26123 [Tritrichomonas foetus]|uniref:Sec23/Sec24 trunk domain containing protein n=1 Tax=Tritrichomonas foetus TaxID=1144522 RepID=A0A1J4K8D5_9EUKA|nr:hypothetical protein TRFO_26123 [Tritrichomonas foetus]|eukprot:OHT05972.1 hypothetical protein TRFO_26123 [Tritrichomonas foetus]
MSHRYVIPDQEFHTLQNQAQNQVQNKFIYPYFFKPSSSAFPRSTQQNPKNIPLGVVITPGMLENVPTVDYRNKYIVHCSCCYGYLSANCIIVPERKAWVCAVCGSLASLPKDYDIEHGIETHSSVYDMIMTPTEKEPFRKMYLIAIDQTRKDFCHKFAASTKKALNKMSDDCFVSLIGFSDSITYYDPIKRASTVISDFENYEELPPFRFLPLKETKEFYLKSLEMMIKTEWKDTNSNFRNLMNFGRLLLKDNGGIFVTSLYGRPEDINEAENSFVIPDNQSEIVDYGFSMNANSISLHVFHQLAAGGNNGFVVTDTIAGLSNGSSHVILPSTEKGDNCGFEETEKELIRVLTQKYCWQSIGKLRTNPKLNLEMFLGNCVIRQNNVCSLSAFPERNSMSYSLLFPQTPLDGKTIGLQFAFMFRKDNGDQISRIFSFLVDIDDNFEPFVDQTVTSVLASKIAVKLMRDSDFNTGIQFIQQKTTFQSLTPSSIEPNVEQHNIGSALVDLDQTNLFRLDYSISSDLKVQECIFVYGANITELMLYLKPREVRGVNSSFKQTNKAVYIIPDMNMKDIVKKDIFEDSGTNTEKTQFYEFYEESKRIISWEQAIVLLE